MRIVISGGAGFLGSHLCEHFLKKGHSVLALDDLSTGRRENLRTLLSSKRFSFRKQDVTKAFSVSGPVDYVLHFASPASPPGYLKRPLETLSVGSRGTENLLELARKNKSGFLLASTSEVYGDPLQSPQKESYWGNVNSVGFRSVYDEAKRYAEAVTMAYGRKYKLRTRIIRIFNTYGERMDIHDGRVIPNFISQALTGKALTVYGSGTQTRSYCYVDDLVAGIERVMRCDHPMPINLGNPNEKTVLELARLILKMTSSKSRIVYKRLPEDDPKRRCPDITLAKRILGWEPKVPLSQGLLKTIAYFRLVLHKEQ